ncbi:MAG TPA: NAD/NADP octopine/nopaline dehydrogenase family protein [Methylomirabilota bacterium]|nr:NAD/NADP octopine/nopaline dehydrogenase family protein [Methylomirabilota bacterium]
MNVVVLGGSNGGYATAADLVLAGHRVRLWQRDAAGLAPIQKAGSLTLVAEERQGTARLDRATADVGEALEGAEVVIVPLPATSHEDIAARLTGRLTGKEIVLLTPGTFGSYVIARALARAGATLPFAFAETGTLPFLTRKTGPATVTAPVRAANLPVGVFPASRAKAVLERVRALFPATRACVDALDAALTNVGPVIHPPLVLVNAASIDAGRFDIHAAGTSPSARRLIDAVDSERVAARRGIGYPAPHYDMATYYDEERAAEGLYGADAKAKLVASGLWSETLTYEHRYVAEDAALGLTLFESAGRMAGVPTPAVSGLLGVFGALLGRALTGGRALDHLGLGDLTRREVLTFLHEGWDGHRWSRVIR